MNVTIALAQSVRTAFIVLVSVAGLLTGINAMIVRTWAVRRTSIAPTVAVLTLRTSSLSSVRVREKARAKHVVTWSAAKDRSEWAFAAESQMDTGAKNVLILCARPGTTGSDIAMVLMMGTFVSFAATHIAKQRTTARASTPEQ